MIRRGTMLVMLLVFFMLAVAPATYAQSVDTSEILSKLAPRSEAPYNFLDIILYVIIVFGLIAMFLVPDKQIFVSMLMIVVIGMAVLAKLGIFGPTEFPTFVVNVGMFVIPLIVAGMLRRKKGKGMTATMPAIATGFFGGVYFFLFWALVQRV